MASANRARSKNSPAGAKPPHWPDAGNSNSEEMISTAKYAKHAKNPDPSPVSSWVSRILRISRSSQSFILAWFSNSLFGVDSFDVRRHSTSTWDALQNIAIPH